MGTKISDLTALTGTGIAVGDLFPIVDVSASTSGTKKITAAELLNGLVTANAAGTALTGANTATDDQFMIYDLSCEVHHAGRTLRSFAACGAGCYSRRGRFNALRHGCTSRRQDHRAGHGYGVRLYLAGRIWYRKRLHLHHQSPGNLQQPYHQGCRCKRPARWRHPHRR